MKNFRKTKFRALKDDMSNCVFVYGNLIYNDNDEPRIQVDNQNLFHTCLKGTEGQFTGTKDINDNDIYEGDILGFKKENQYSNEPLAVKFFLGSFVVYNPNCCDVCKNAFGCISDIGECLAISGCAEVIGNIHENKEIFEQLKTK